MKFYSRFEFYICFIHDRLVAYFIQEQEGATLVIESTGIVQDGVFVFVGYWHVSTIIQQKFWK